MRKGNKHSAVSGNSDRDVDRALGIVPGQTDPRHYVFRKNLQKETEPTEAPPLLSANVLYAVAVRTTDRVNRHIDKNVLVTKYHSELELNKLCCDDQRVNRDVSGI